MRCSRVRKLLVAREDGELPLHERERVEHHLRRCEPCADEADRLARTRPVAPRLPELPESFWNPLHEAVQSAVDAHCVQRASHSWPHRGRLLAVGLAWAALAALAVQQAIHWQGGEPLPEPDRVEADILPAAPRSPRPDPAVVPVAPRVETVSYTPHYGTF